MYNRISLLSWFVLFLTVFALAASISYSLEKLDRGLIALERKDGSVYIGWRSLASDHPKTTFHIVGYGSNQNPAKPMQWSTQSTNVIHQHAQKGETYTYRLAIQHEGGERQDADEVKITLTGNSQNYIRIPFQGDYVIPCT